MFNMSFYTKHANFGVQMFIKSVKIRFPKSDVNIGHLDGMLSSIHGQNMVQNDDFHDQGVTNITFHVFNGLYIIIGHYDGTNMVSFDENRSLLMMENDV